MAERTGYTLVLGGGGFPAHAYLSGAFAAFADAGLEPRDAAHVVGTSAGALHTALIGAGCSAAELAHLAERFSQSAGERHFKRSWRGGTDPAARSLGGLRVLLVLASKRKRLRRVRASPRWGLVETRDPERYFGLMPVEWPDQRLTFLSYDLVDGRRRGLTGADNLGLGVPEAVAASAALPGVMAPVLAGPHFLVDGGCASLTNLDAACGGDTLLTVCVAPMSFDPHLPPRWLLHVLYAKAVCTPRRIEPSIVRPRLSVLTGRA